MSETIQFWVPGIPRPGGSKKGFYNPKLGRVMMVKDGGQKEENWRQAVAYAAMRAMGLEPENRVLPTYEPPLSGPLWLDVTFYLPRPKNHYWTGKRAGQLRDDAPTYHDKKPDRTKLLRALEDALRGICWRDDAQVSYGCVTKVYSERPGATVKVAPAVAVTAAELKPQPTRQGE